MQPSSFNSTFNQVFNTVQSAMGSGLPAVNNGQPTGQEVGDPAQGLYVAGTEPEPPTGQPPAGCIETAAQKLRSPFGPLSKAQDVALSGTVAGLAASVVVGGALVTTLNLWAAAMIGTAAGGGVAIITVCARVSCLNIDC